MTTLLGAIDKALAALRDEDADPAAADEAVAALYATASQWHAPHGSDETCEPCKRGYVRGFEDGQEKVLERLREIVD